MSNEQLITSELEGFKELEDRLLSLAELGTDKDSFQSMNFAIRKALQPVKDRAQQLVPFDDDGGDGHLRDSIKISVPRNPKKILRIKDRAAFGMVIVGTKDRNPAKALAHEFGLDKSRHLQPRPFLRPALYQKQGEVIKILRIQLGKAIDRRVKRLSKGGK